MPDYTGSIYGQSLAKSQQDYGAALSGYTNPPAAQPTATPGLPQFQGNPNFDFSGNPASLSANYASSYQGAANYNNQLGQAIGTGFDQTMAAQQQAQQGLQAGYGKLNTDVLAGIQGIGQSQANAINRAYTAQSGASAQGLVSRGLGNTTVADSVQRGLGYDRANAQTSLANQIAGLNAGYQSNLGLAGLNFGNQANMQNTALANQKLNWMNSVNAPYPNAGLYGQLAQQYGASQNQQRLLDALSAARGAGGGQRGIGGGSYVPTGSGNRPDTQSYGGAATSGFGGGSGGYNQYAMDLAAGKAAGQAGGQGATLSGLYDPTNYLDPALATNAPQGGGGDWGGNGFMAATGFPYLGSPAGQGGDPNQLQLGYDLGDYEGY